MTLQPEDEKTLIIEVDEYDNYLGLRPITDFSGGKHTHRSSQLILTNTAGEILVKRRRQEEHIYPGLITFSADGTVENEPYWMCILRETYEELGVFVPFFDLFRFFCRDENDSSFHTVFQGRYDEKYAGLIKPNPKETAEIVWRSPAELEKSMRSNPEQYTPPFLKGMNIYFSDFYARI